VTPKNPLSDGSATTAITAAKSITIQPSAASIANDAKEAEVLKTNKEQARVNGLRLTSDARVVTVTTKPAGFAGLTENNEFVYTYSFGGPYPELNYKTGITIYKKGSATITVSPAHPLNVGSATTSITAATQIEIHPSKTWLANIAKEAESVKTNREQSRVNGLHLVSDENVVTGSNKPAGFAGLIEKHEFIYTYDFKSLSSKWYPSSSGVIMGRVLITVKPRNPLMTGVPRKNPAYPTFIEIHSSTLITELLNSEQERVNGLTPHNIQSGSGEIQVGSTDNTLNGLFVKTEIHSQEELMTLLDQLGEGSAITQDPYILTQTIIIGIPSKIYTTEVRPRSYTLLVKGSAYYVTINIIDFHPLGKNIANHLSLNSHNYDSNGVILTVTHKKIGLPEGYRYKYTYVTSGSGASSHIAVTVTVVNTEGTQEIRSTVNALSH
ncbi:MAG: hypothetical protein KAG14_03635, partial [Mycoplasmataceae bacterium]|nr:hypothetical protein [Mycoplasmataceae bacterium]